MFCGDGRDPAVRRGQMDTPGGGVTMVALSNVDDAHAVPARVRDERAAGFAELWGDVGGEVDRVVSATERRKKPTW